MKKTLILTALLLFWGASFAGIKTYECPEKIHFEGGRLAAADIPAGFKDTISSAPVWLSGASVYDGPPEEGAELKPINAEKKSSRILWDTSNTSEKGIWLVCNYADQLVKISVKAEGMPSSCEASVKRYGLPKILHTQFTCKY